MDQIYHIMMSLGLLKAKANKNGQYHLALPYSLIMADAQTDQDIRFVVNRFYGIYAT